MQETTLRVRIIKRLTLISLVLFFLPFFQTCSDDNIRNRPFMKVEMPDSKESRLKAFLEKKRELTHNGYGLAFSVFKDLSINPFEINYLFLPFTVIMILIFLAVFYAYKEKIKKVLILNIIILLLLLGSLIWHYLGDLLEDINQIKLGYYLFTILSIIQIFLTTISLRTSKSKT